MLIELMLLKMKWRVAAAAVMVVVAYGRVWSRQ
jgi:hypothetical protein